MEEIAVVGGGALGMLWTARLAAAGMPVVLHVRTAVQAERLRAEGIVWETTDRRVVRQPVSAVSMEERPPARTGVVLLTVKQTAIRPALLERLAALTEEDGIVVACCNGVGHLERLEAALPGRRVYAAVTTEGALRTGPAEVRHTGAGEVWIGPMDSAGQQGPEADLRLARVAISLGRAGISTYLSNNMTERVLRKLLVNAVINPLTALWGVANGELTATPAREAAARALFAETAGILARCGLPDAAGLWGDIAAVCAATAANRSSMLQDVLHGRETEIEAINGAVARMADGLGLAAPWNRTVATLVQGLAPLPGS